MRKFCIEILKLRHLYSSKKSSLQMQLSYLPIYKDINKYVRIIFLHKNI